MHFQDWRRKILGSKNNTLIQFLNEIEEFNLSQSVEKTHEPENIWSKADSKLAAILIEPNIIADSLITNIQVVIDGKARGSLLVDYGKDFNKNPGMANVKVVQNMDEILFRNILLDLFH